MFPVNNGSKLIGTCGVAILKDYNPQKGDFFFEKLKLRTLKHQRSRAKSKQYLFRLRNADPLIGKKPKCCPVKLHNNYPRVSQVLSLILRKTVGAFFNLNGIVVYSNKPNFHLNAT